MGLLVTHAYNLGWKAKVYRQHCSDGLAFVFLSFQLLKAKCLEEEEHYSQVTAFSRMGDVTFGLPIPTILNRALPVVDPSCEGNLDAPSRNWEAVLHLSLVC